MGEHALTVKTVRDGLVCALILSGDLDLSETAGFLGQAALAVDNRTERLVLDLAGVTFLDCAGVRALAMAASFAPSGCPVIIRSLSPVARRILELLDLDAASIRQASPAPRTTEGPGLGNQSAGTWPYRSRAVLAATGGDPDG
jgi:anti-anti-sigma factor